MVKYQILLLTGVLSLLLAKLPAQEEVMKWGKLTEEEAALVSYPANEKAAAVVLGDYGAISVNIQVEGILYKLRRHKRIKILKPSYTNPRTIRIPYDTRKDADKITSFKVQLFSPEGRKSSINKKNISDIQVDQYNFVRVCTLPELEPGSVVEYRYEIVSNRTAKIDDWHFQEELPVKYGELRVEIPEWLEYIALTEGPVQYEKVDKENAFALEIDNEATILERDPRVRVVTSRYFIRNAPPVKEIPLASSQRDCRIKVQLRLNRIHYPNGKSQSFVPAWEELAGQLKAAPDFGGQYFRTDNHQKLLAASQGILDDESGKPEQIRALCDFLNSRVKWDSSYSIYASRTLDQLFQAGSASSGELNLMLIALLRANGIKAAPLLISTRSHGRMIQQYAIADQFNHLLVQVQNDGNTTLLLDLSDPFRPSHYPRVEALNGYGWLLNEDGGEWIVISPEGGSDLIVATAALSTAGNISGSMQCKYTGYRAVAERRKYEQDRQGRYWRARLDRTAKQVKVDSFTAVNFGEIREPFQTEISFHLSEAATQEGDKLLFSPVLFTKYAQSLLEEEERLWPVDIPYPFKEQFVVKLKIPEGYRVESLPESVRILIRNKGGAYHYVLNENQGYLELINKIQVRQIKYQPEDYGNIKDFFDLVEEKVSEQVVLRKVGSN